MSVVSHHHYDGWRHLREYVTRDEFAGVVTFLLIAIAVAVIVFAPASFQR
jgi:hypothetical protein